MTKTILKMALIASGATLLIAAGPKADLDQDGQVTQAEFTQAAQAHFLAADTNGDSLLSEEERKAFHEIKKTERQNKRFDELDANGDGSISREEMDALGEKYKSRKEDKKAKKLERYDTNLDGELSEAERAVMEAERAEKHGDRKEGRRGKRGERPNPDTNADGFVSFDEHMAMSEQLFTRLDANADGVLTKGEGKKRRRGKRGPKRGE